ncbi:MAG: DUF4143 domain-containing protein [Coriobacteriia bacterium]|nr:DUF4143 domain-containing protein [Coriobacteriia bacterium]
MSAYKNRLLDPVIETYFAQLPALSLDGAKAVGKTATASRYASHILHVDRDDGEDIIQGGFEVLKAQQRPLLIDEWQRYPRSWDYVRRLVDEDYSPGQFLLTGSAIPREAQTHSGAGRIVRFRMRPMSLQERGLLEPTVSLKDLLSASVDRVSGSSNLNLTNYIEEIVASGFPGIRKLPNPSRELALDGYIKNLIEREFQEAGTFVRKPAILNNWLKAYGAATSSTTSYETILAASTPGEANKPSSKTTLSYRDTLDSLWMTDRVPAWAPSGSHLTALSKSPKHFLADPALAARLLRIDAQQLIRGTRHPLIKTISDKKVKKEGAIGRFFEALVALSLQTYAQVNNAELSHFRTRNGDREIDFIIEGGNAIVAIEVKSSASVDNSDVKHLNWLAEKYSDYNIMRIIITTGQNAYTRTDGVHVIPAALLGA